VPELAKGQEPGVSTQVRDHAHTLSDFRVPTLSIECEPCGRLGRYNVARLMEKYGDAKLPELRHVLANCRRRTPTASMIVARCVTAKTAACRERKSPTPGSRPTRGLTASAWGWATAGASLGLTGGGEGCSRQAGGPASALSGKPSLRGAYERLWEEDARAFRNEPTPGLFHGASLAAARCGSDREVL
jgi:hypothetical protein